MTTEGHRTFVDLGSGPLEVRDQPAEGDGRARPPLVFLHEGLGSVDLWRAVPERLRLDTGRPRTVTYSRAGYGRSAPPPPVPARTDRFLHDEGQRVLPALLGRLGITAPALVGHSDGASIALLHAGAGAAVAGLVLIAPHVFVEDRSIEGIEAARGAYVAGPLRDRLARHHTHVDVAFRGWCDTWLSESFRRWDITDHLAGVTCPVLLVQGEDDAYGTLAQLDAIASGVRGPVERLVLPGVGHAPHLEAPDRVLPVVARFLSALDRSAPVAPG